MCDPQGEIRHAHAPCVRKMNSSVLLFFVLSFVMGALLNIKRPPWDERPASPTSTISSVSLEHEELSFAGSEQEEHCEWPGCSRSSPQEPQEEPGRREMNGCPHSQLHFSLGIP